jgi:RES domain-containing protein
VARPLHAPGRFAAAMLASPFGLWASVDMSQRMKLPPIDQLQSEATALRAEHDPQVLYERMRSFLAPYGVFNYTIRQYGAPLWRARLCADSNGYSRLGDVHYPPPSKARIGRLNEQGSPLLYVCFTAFTAFSEVKANLGDILHTVRYELRRPLRTLLLGEINNVHKRGQGLLPGDASSEITTKLLGRISTTAARLSFVFMDAFLSAVLSDPQSEQRDHLHSRTLARVLLEQNPAIEAITYPSVASDGSMNLAIRPAAADEALRITGTTIVHVDKQYDYGLFDFTIIRNSTSFSEAGEIRWSA